jgi:hypothetical protein
MGPAFSNTKKPKRTELAKKVKKKNIFNILT